MCRWIAYAGPSIYLDDLVTAPTHSLINQSQSCHEAKLPTNGDGFGLAWYGDHREPGLYRDILPAWSDQNLFSLCKNVRSHNFLAHVRASTQGATARANCHPFVSGRWSFVHNGQIGSFDHIERSVEALLDDRLYRERQGSTDSELLFLLLRHLELDNDPAIAFDRAIETINEVADRQNIKPLLRLTLAVSDGETIWALRYASDDKAPSLYTKQWRDGCCLASEPVDEAEGAWQAVPANSIVTLRADGHDMKLYQMQ